MSTKKRALGRGLSALLEDANVDISSSFQVKGTAEKSGSITTLLLEQIEANPFQPRIDMNRHSLIELAESIKTHGIIQPVTVRKLGYDKYQLISGERRFRAAQLAGLADIPVYVRIANDQAMLELALVENIQREDLDAIEIAISYKRLIDECKLTQEALSEKVSKQRSTISNYLRLLKLPAEIQLGIKDKHITMGHARALVNIEDTATQSAIFEQIVINELSVRQVEKLVRDGVKKSSHGKALTPTLLSFTHQKIKEDMSLMLNKKVELKRSKSGKGKIVIPFSSDEDLQRIIEILNT